ncbi:arsenate reductase family protein [Algivirga pacifica]|uniref:Arsenate reductase n=1 Tax=Algivirga pacifica TaxID=1162670 RepID=A0ABP9D9N9_9BACT
MYSNKKNIMEVFYHPGSSLHKQTVAYAKSMSSKVVTTSYGQDAFTTTIWKYLLKKLNKTPKELLNKSDPFYQKNIRGKEFDSEGWLNVLMKHPFLIRGPIVVWKNKARLVETPTDIMKM